MAKARVSGWPRALVVAVALAPVTTLASPLEDGRAAAARGDFTAAIASLEQAAEAGSLEAETDLGLLYERGAGAQPDLAEARMWFLRAAEEGVPAAETNLARLYAEGLSVRADPAEAARWYRLAAAQGYPLAEANLAELYLDGRGVARDLVLAHMWATLAIAGGEPSAAITRDKAAAAMAPADVVEATRRAADWTPALPAHADRAGSPGRFR
jgi:TPR repeat protein